MPKDRPTRKARKADGSEVNPLSGVVPILKEISKKRLSVIGTGFFISRYGLFATAAHVVQALVDEGELGISYLLHAPENQENVFHLRKIMRVTFFNEVDLAVGQANNFVERYPENPLSNLRCILNTTVPEAGSSVYTYAFPENRIMDFNEENPPMLSGGIFEGGFLSVENKGENPIIPYNHYSTSIRVRSGASGGPVFLEDGSIVGVNCRGWDFDGAEYQGNELSTIIPINYIREMGIELMQLPEISWEYQQIPKDRLGSKFTINDLVEFGHILIK